MASSPFARDGPRTCGTSLALGATSRPPCVRCTHRFAAGTSAPGSASRGRIASLTAYTNLRARLQQANANSCFEPQRTPRTPRRERTTGPAKQQGRDNPPLPDPSFSCFVFFVPFVVKCSAAACRCPAGITLEARTVAHQGQLHTLRARVAFVALQACQTNLVLFRGRGDRRPGDGLVPVGVLG